VRVAGGRELRASKNAGLNLGDGAVERERREGRETTGVNRLFYISGGRVCNLLEPWERFGGRVNQSKKKCWKKPNHGTLTSFIIR
jgi:hypothetical protein